MEKEEVIIKKDKLNIPAYAKLKIYWDDKPENYSKEAKVEVRNHFAKKYGVNKSNITVVYRPVKFNNKGETIEITGSGIENIMDISYQRELFKHTTTSGEMGREITELKEKIKELEAELKAEKDKPKETPKKDIYGENKSGTYGSNISDLWKKKK